MSKFKKGDIIGYVGRVRIVLKITDKFYHVSRLDGKYDSSYKLSTSYIEISYKLITDIFREE